MFLDNFIALFKNSAFRDAAKNTATFSALAVPLATVLALGLAMLLEARIPLKSQFRTFFLSPMMVPWLPSCSSGRCSSATTAS